VNGDKITDEDNIKMYLTEIGYECVDWIYLAKTRPLRHLVGLGLCREMEM
jgi:hypothetical protein